MTDCITVSEDLMENPYFDESLKNLPKWKVTK